MTDALEMSLDEIIQKNRQEKKQQHKKKPQPKQKPKQSQNSLASVADKLVVSNLAVTVTQNDVKELFARIGPVKSAQLNYDSNGKSKGVANVTFVKAGDAQKAFNEYHNRPLDNKPMKIELIINPDSAKLKHLTKPVLGQKPGAGVGKPKRKPKPKNQRKDMSAMDLDAEMESYMNDNAAPSLADALA